MEKPNLVAQIMAKALNAAHGVLGDPTVKELAAGIAELHDIERELIMDVRELEPHERAEVAELDALLIDARKLERELWIKLDCHLTAKGL